MRLLVTFAPASGALAAMGGNPAIPLRKDAETPAVTEWDSSRPETVSAAFAATALWGEDRDRIAVRVQVSGAVQVRAFSEEGLGRVEPTWVREEAVVALTGARIAKAGTDVREVALRWETLADGEWADAGTMRVRLYTMPGPPTEPWTLFPGETPYHVWTDVLDVACAWARGAIWAGDAGAMITRAIYDMGRDGAVGRISYNDFGRRYGSVAGLDPVRNEMTVESFDVRAFLERVAGREGRGAEFNCFDTAGAVATFASALGFLVRKVSFSREGEADFRLHPVRLLGEIPWHDPAIGGVFNGHTVGWAGPLDERGQVYDPSVGLIGADGEFAPSAGLFWGTPEDMAGFRARLSPDAAELRLNREYRPLLLVPPRLVWASDAGSVDGAV